jgi:hypothetical protein
MPLFDFIFHIGAMQLARHLYLRCKVSGDVLKLAGGWQSKPKNQLKEDKWQPMT